MRLNGFIGPSYTSLSPNVDAERLVNWYPELVESQGGKGRVVYYPVPGYVSFMTVTTRGGCRAAFAQDGRVFAVIGPNFIELTSGPVATSRGTVIDDGLPATISSNGKGGNQLFVTSGGFGYTFTLTTNTFAIIPSSQSFPASVQMGTFVDGYFVAFSKNTSSIQLSALNDGTLWSGLDIASRNDSSDQLVAVAVLHRELWLFGSLTTETWYNSGATFPFQPFPGRLMEQGCAAPWSLVVLDNTLFWVGADRRGAGIVYMVQQDVPQRISTMYLERVIQGYQTISDAVAYAYQEQGHSFYVLTFPSGNATWVYDVSTKLWHERGYWNSVRSDFDARPERFHCYGFGQHLVGDSRTGAIYVQGIPFVTEADTSRIVRLRRAPHIFNEAQWQFFSQFDLCLETGIAPDKGQCAGPQVMLRWSDDGGHVWSNEYWVSAGLSGNYRARALWRRLGRSRDRVFEVRVSDPIPWRLIDAYLLMGQGAPV